MLESFPVALGYETPRSDSVMSESYAADIGFFQKQQRAQAIAVGRENALTYVYFTPKLERITSNF